MATHHIHPDLLTRPVTVAVVGAGGTGSQVLTGLAQLHLAMRALGHPGGLKVTAYDDDLVSQANIGRQLFYPCDVGLPKAVVLINRINMSMGTHWGSSVTRFNGDATYADIVIGCVDTRSSRAAIHMSLSHAHRPAYWLDIGNRQSDGQVILGECGARHFADRLPHAADLFPEVVDETKDGDEDGPSCSLAEALEKQSLFINRGVALYALNLLFELFRYGEIQYHGVFVNLKTARTSPLAIDPQVWARFGYEPSHENENPG